MSAKKLIFVFGGVFFILNAFAQENLVPNPSFEQFIVCPSNYDEVSSAVGWAAYRESPDYYNSCDTGMVSVPSNGFGFQHAATGQAYCGIINYEAEYREVIGCQLLSTLIVGKTYEVSFKIALGNPPPNVNCATNNIGAILSTVPYNYSNPIPINNFAHVKTDTIITDTINWSSISGKFVADSAYEYMAIGNFFNDISTDTIQTFYWFGNCNNYYFIDDVYLGEDTLINSGDIHSLDRAIVLYPNPTTDGFAISSFSYPISVELYSSRGQLISSQLINNPNNRFDLQGKSAGLYYVKIIQGNHHIIKTISKLP